jgi:hypothetical protein
VATLKAKQLHNPQANAHGFPELQGHLKECPSRLRKNSRLYRHHSAAAKAGIDFAGLTVRLEAAPFQIMARIRVFRSLLRKITVLGLLNTRMELASTTAILRWFISQSEFVGSLFAIGKETKTCHAEARDIGARMKAARLS